MYIRFETKLTFKNTDCRKGVFAAMGDVKKKGTMSLAEHVWYINTANGLNKYLQIPDCYNQPMLNHVIFKTHCWFKCNGKSIKYIDKALAVSKLLRAHDILVIVHVDHYLDNIIYEDDVQVVTRTGFL